MKIVLTPAQQDIVRDNHRYRVICCGRRFGKTTIAVLEMIGKAVSANDLNVLYVAPTFQQARDIAWTLLKKIASPVIIKANETQLELLVKTKDGGQSRIFLRGWESIETARGMKLDFLILDEISSYRYFAENWEEVLRACLTDSQAPVMFISTPKGFNHFYDLYQKELKDKDYKSFHFTSYDNPFLIKDELDKAKQEIPEDRFAQEYLADFRKTEGLVYKEFNRQFHIRENTDGRFKEIISGVDFGYTNPSGILKIGIDYDNYFWVLEEFYKTKQTTEGLGQILKDFEPNVVYPDPAEPDRIETLRQMGFNCREVSKDVDAGIDYVRELLLQGRIRISKNCPNLIREFETYCYEDGKEKPIKEFDHLLDALKYALYSHRPVNDDFGDLMGIRENRQERMSNELL